MDIFCLNPVIIQSHTLAYNLSLYKRYHTPNGIVQIDKDKAASYRYFFPKYQYSCLIPRLSRAIRIRFINN
jgi:nitrate reductase beta subunit